MVPPDTEQNRCAAMAHRAEFRWLIQYFAGHTRELRNPKFPGSAAVTLKGSDRGDRFPVVVEVVADGDGIKVYVATRKVATLRDGNEAARALEARAARGSCDRRGWYAPRRAVVG